MMRRFRVLSVLSRTALGSALRSTRRHLSSLAQENNNNNKVFDLVKLDREIREANAELAREFGQTADVVRDDGRAFLAPHAAPSLREPVRNFAPTSAALAEPASPCALTERASEEASAIASTARFLAAAGAASSSAHFILQRTERGVAILRDVLLHKATAGQVVQIADHEVEGLLPAAIFKRLQAEPGLTCAIATSLPFSGLPAKVCVCERFTTHSHLHHG
jgi:hypothetical protein